MSHSSPGAFAHQREKLLHEESLAKEEKLLGSYGCVLGTLAVFLPVNIHATTSFVPPGQLVSSMHGRLSVTQLSMHVAPLATIDIELSNASLIVFTVFTFLFLFLCVLCGPCLVNMEGFHRLC